MSLRLAVSVIALTVAIGAADDVSSKAQRLAGKWTLADGESGRGTTTWMFEPDGEKVKITRMQGSEKRAEFECNTVGKECEVKQDGKKAKISMYFLGPKLVQFETTGSDVVKRRFTVADQDTLEVEVIPITQGGSPETIHFKRAEVAAQTH